MDINVVRSVVTVVAFILFIGIVWWAYSSKSKAGFDEAALLPLDDDSPLVPVVSAAQATPATRKAS